jgi:hypothetical protein
MTWHKSWGVTRDEEVQNKILCKLEDLIIKFQTQEQQASNETERREVDSPWGNYNYLYQKIRRRGVGTIDGLPIYLIRNCSDTPKASSYVTI